MKKTAEIFFLEGFVQEVKGTICAGKVLKINYNARRFAEQGARFPTGEYGMPMWTITWYYQLFSGDDVSPVTICKLDNVEVPGGQATDFHSTGSTILPEKTDRIAMWFSYDGHNPVTPDDEPILWDSQYGENYQFPVS